MRWQFVDCYGTRLNWDKISISQEDLFIHEETIPQLLRYSTKLRQDLHFPTGLSHPRGDNSSTATVLDSTETRSLFSKRIYSSLRRQFLDCHDNQLNLRQDLYSPRGFIHPRGDNSSTATVLDSRWDKISTSQEDLAIHEVTIHRLLRHSTQDETRSPLPKRTQSSMRWQFVNCYSTRHKLRQDLNFPRRFIHPWDDNTSTTTTLNFEKIQDF